MLLREKKFYDFWKNQYQDDLKLNELIDKDKRSTKFGLDFWNNNIINNNKARYNKIPIGKIQ